MTTKDNGWPAFPCDRISIGDKVICSDGMTLRDYFAAKALQGMLATDNEDFESQELRRKDYSEYCKSFAEAAYLFADAMLEARKS